MFAFEDAARHWEAAVRRLRRLHDPKTDLELAGLLERLAAIIFASGSDPDHGVAAVEEALAIYEQRGDTERAAAPFLGSARCSTPSRGEVDVPKALEHFAAPRRRSALAAIEPVPTSASAMNALMRMLRLAEAADASERAVDIANRIGDRVLWSNAGWLLGWSWWEAGRLARRGARARCLRNGRRGERSR